MTLAPAPQPSTSPPAPQPALAIALSGVARQLGREPVLRSIDLEVGAGRLVVLRGSNGAGKTTLLRVLATRLRPSAGSGAVFGHDLVREADAVRGRIGMLGSLGGNYPVLSGRENLALALRLAGKPAAGGRGAGGPGSGGTDVGVAGVGPGAVPPGALSLEQALAAVGLHGAADKLVRAYSSGMKKRLGLARQLLLDPDLWLLDEPHAALDEAGKALVDRCVMEARARGRTVLMSSHESERNGLEPDAVVLLERGVLRLLSAAPRPVGSAA